MFVGNRETVLLPLCGWLRGDAIKYSEWPPYNVGGQRKINVAYYIGLYIYLYARSIVFDFF